MARTLSLATILAVTLSFVVGCGSTPGGVDSGTDAGADAGSDAGADAGSDAGADAGSDAGADAGSDAGLDAGACVAGSQNSTLIFWASDSNPAGSAAILVIIDSAANLDFEVQEEFDVDVWSDTDINGISLTVRETGDNTAIFQGEVLISVSEESSGDRLMVSVGDAVIAEYRRTRATSCVE